MGHSIGISDSYYKITEEDLLNDYLKAIDLLTIGNEFILNKKISEINEQSRSNAIIMRSELSDKQEEITILNKQYVSNVDAITALSEHVIKLTREIESLKNGRKVGILK